jgi:hypothetical protein
MVTQTATPAGLLEVHPWKLVCEENVWILQGTPSDCPEFHAVLTAGVQGAKRRSFDLHAMARSGAAFITWESR